MLPARVIFTARADFISLQSGQLQDLVHGSLETIGVLAACRSKVRLSAATAEDKFGGFLDQRAGLQSVSHELLAQHDGQHRPVLKQGSGHEAEAVAQLAAQLEGDILGRFGRNGSAEGDDFHAVHLLGALQEFLLQLGFLLLHEVLDLLLQSGVLVNVLADGARQVRGIVEEGAQVAQGVLHAVQHLLHLGTRQGLDAAHAGGNGAF